MSGFDSHDNVNSPPTCRFLDTSRLPMTATETLLPIVFTLFVDSILLFPHSTNVDVGAFMIVVDADASTVDPNTFKILVDFTSYSVNPLTPIDDTGTSGIDFVLVVMIVLDKSIDPTDRMRPFIVADAPKETAPLHNSVPSICEDAPVDTAPTAIQNIMSVVAPFTRIMVLVAAVANAAPIWKMNIAFGRFIASIVITPEFVIAAVAWYIPGINVRSYKSPAISNDTGIFKKKSATYATLAIDTLAPNSNAPPIVREATNGPADTHATLLVQEHGPIHVIMEPNSELLKRPYVSNMEFVCIIVLANEVIYMTRHTINENANCIFE